MKDGRILVWELKEMLKSTVSLKEGVIREAFECLGEVGISQKKVYGTYRTAEGGIPAAYL